MAALEHDFLVELVGEIDDVLNGSIAVSIVYQYYGEYEKNLSTNQLMEVNDVADEALREVESVARKLSEFYQDMKEIVGPIRQELARRYMRGLGVQGAPPSGGRWRDV